MFDKLKEKLPEIKSDISLKNYSTFRIGGKAKYFLKVQSKKDLVSALKTVKEFNIPFYVIGGGSKLLISDQGFNGLVIKTENNGVECNDNILVSGSGTTSNKLMQVALQNSLTGTEWLAGIPGTVGGAVRGNAGAFEGSMSDIVQEVEAFDLNSGEIIRLNNQDCEFGYRDSIFKQDPNLVILSVKIKLERGDKEKIKKEMDKYFSHRRKCHPLQYPSVGCIFTNPVDPKTGEELQAWKVIVDCGLDGKQVGNVKVSEKHSNFIVNLGDGKAEEVKELIKIIKETVKEKLGVIMEEEVQYL